MRVLRRDRRHRKPRVLDTQNRCSDLILHRGKQVEPPPNSRSSVRRMRPADSGREMHPMIVRSTGISGTRQRQSWKKSESASKQKNNSHRSTIFRSIKIIRADEYSPSTRRTPLRFQPRESPKPHLLSNTPVAGRMANGVWTVRPMNANSPLVEAHPKDSHWVSRSRRNIEVIVAPVRP